MGHVGGRPQKHGALFRAVLLAVEYRLPQEGQENSPVTGLISITNPSSDITAHTRYVSSGGGVA